MSTIKTYAGELITEYLEFDFDDVHRLDDDHERHCEEHNNNFDEDDAVDVVSDYFTSIFMEALAAVCLDKRGNRRKSLGIVNSMINDEEAEYDERFVPSFRYSFEISSPFAHQYGVTFELPNPAIDIAEYTRIRTRMIETIQEIALEHGIHIIQ